MVAEEYVLYEDMHCVNTHTKNHSVIESRHQQTGDNGHNTHIMSRSLPISSSTTVMFRVRACEKTLSGDNVPR